MNTIKLNIGLENNPKSFTEVSKNTNWMLCFGLFESREEVGEYEGKPERTAVIKLTNDVDSESTVIEFVEYLTTIFIQDCIAVKINDVGYLVYNPEYKGEKFEFNNEYFIEP